MAQHTQTPWFKFEMDEATGNIAIGAPHPFASSRIANVTAVSTRATGAREETEANAAFIVKAVNAHDDLVAALSATLDRLSMVDSSHPSVEQAVAALAKAKGE